MLKKRLLVCWFIAVVSTPCWPRETDLARRAETEFSIGHGAEAMKLWQQALVEHRSTGDLAGQLNVLERLGTTAKLMGQPSVATRYLVEALDTARRVDRAGMEIEILTKLAEAASESNDYPVAIRANRELHAHAEATRDVATASVAAARLGQALLDSDQPQPAVPAFRRAAELFHILGQKPNEGAALDYLGDALRRIENYVAAVDAYREATKIAHESGHSGLEAEATHGLGVSLYYLGDYSGATDALKKAIRLARLAGERSTETAALMTLGNVQYFLDQPEAALRSYQQVLETARKQQNKKLESETLGNMGLTLAHLNQFDQAEEYFRKDIAIAKERGDRLVESQALGNLAGLFIYQKHYIQSIPLLQRSIELARERHYTRGESIALRNLGLAQLFSGQPAAAESSLKKAIIAQEALRNQTSGIDKYNISLFDTHSDSYRLLQAALIAQNKPGEALEASELGRARALADLMAQQAAAPPSIDTIRSIARNRNQTLVEFSVIAEDNAIYIWAVRPDGTVNFRRANIEMHGDNIDNALQNLVHETRSALGTPGTNENIRRSDGTGKANNLLNVFYRLLIAPVEELLPPSPDEPVVLIPQGALFLLPFAALIDDNNRTLLESHALLVAPSIQTLKLLDTRPDKLETKQAFVAGNPKMSLVKLSPSDNTFVTFPPLPAAEHEAVTVAALLGTRPLTGASATKSAFLTETANADIIHLATHGIADDVHGQGIPGALVLAGDRGDDGLLSSSEIMHLKLHANLVVLSACNTGLGKISSDGVLGLSRAFLAAGARSVVVSLWSVPDQPTAELMQYFYEKLTHASNKAAALRHAMLATRSKHSNPLAWAGFILVGESE